MSEPSIAPENRAGLGDQVRVLRRRWPLVALVTLVLVAASLVFSYSQTPQYRSTTEVLLAPTVFDVQRGGAEISPEEVATQVRVVTSRPVADLVRDDLRLAETPSLTTLVTVEALGNARVLRITARANDATDAAEISQSVASSYLSYRQTNTRRSLDEVSAVLTERQEQIETRIDELDDALGQRRDPTGELEAERSNLLSQLGAITTQLASLDITVSSGAGGDVLTSVDSGTQQVAPRPVLNGVLSLFIGLLLGIGLAFARDRFDKVAHDTESIEASLGGAKVLSRIPRWETGAWDEDPITVTHSASDVSQSFQSLAARVRYVVGRAPNARGKGHVVMCTSAETEEGSTEVAANLAVAAARVGMQVVLIDADLRPHSEPLRMSPASAPGLADVLVGGSLDHFLLPGPVDNLMILPAGDPPPDPTGLMVSVRMDSLVSELRRRLDLIVMVTPPSMEYADALELSAHADLNLLVARIGRSRLPSVRAVSQRFRDIGADDLGAVVIGGKARRSGRTSRPRGASRGQPRRPTTQATGTERRHGSDANAVPGLSEPTSPRVPGRT